MSDSFDEEVTQEIVSKNVRDNLDINSNDVYKRIDIADGIIENVDENIEIIDLKQIIMQIANDMKILKVNISEMRKDITHHYQILENLTTCYNRTYKFKKIIPNPNFQTPVIPFQTIPSLENFNKKLFSNTYLEQMVSYILMADK